MISTLKEPAEKLQTKIGNYRWTICSLVFFATTINYLDRQVISLLKPTLEKEFHWTESDYSNIVVAFQFAYALGMIGAGRPAAVRPSASSSLADSKVMIR